MTRIIDLNSKVSVDQDDFLLVHSTGEAQASKIKAVDLLVNNVSTSTNNVLLLDPSQTTLNVPSGQVTVVLPHTDTTSGSEISINMPSNPNVGDMIVFVKSLYGISSDLKYKLNFDDKSDTLYYGETKEGIVYGLSKISIVDYLMYTIQGWFLSAYELIDTRFIYVDFLEFNWQADDSSPKTEILNALNTVDGSPILYYYYDYSETFASESSADLNVGDANSWDTTNSEEKNNRFIEKTGGSTNDIKTAFFTPKESGSKGLLNIQGKHDPNHSDFPNAEIITGITVSFWFNPFVLPNSILNNYGRHKICRWNFEDNGNTTRADPNKDVFTPPQVDLQLSREQDKNGNDRCLLVRSQSGYYPYNVNGFPSRAYLGNYNYTDVVVSAADGMEIDNNKWHLVIWTEVLYPYEEGNKKDGGSKFPWNCLLCLVTKDKFYHLAFYEYYRLNNEEGYQPTTLTNDGIMYTAADMNFQLGNVDNRDTSYQISDVRLWSYPLTTEKDFMDLAKYYGYL